MLSAVSGHCRGNFPLGEIPLQWQRPRPGSLRAPAGAPWNSTTSRASLPSAGRLWLHPDLGNEELGADEISFLSVLAHCLSHGDGIFKGLLTKQEGRA